MCGIFGVSSNFSFVKSEADFIQQATFTGTLRGVDSTGLGLVDKGGKCKVYKRALSGPDFLVSSTGGAALREMYSTYLALGHNRAATKGKISDDTAHPYNFGRVMGCHNGTLATTRGLTETKMGVDSMNLYASLNELEDGDYKAMTDMLADLNGSFALVWYEFNTELLYFVRNDKRPMYYWQEKTGSPLFWASEGEMLYWLLARCNRKPKFSDIKPLPEDSLCAFNTVKGEIEEITTYTPKPAPVYNTGGWCGTHYNGNGTRQQQHKPSTTDGATFRWDDYYETRIKIVPLNYAIKEKLWDKDDKEVMCWFHTVDDEDKGQVVRHLRGHAVTSSGEQFDCVVWAKDSQARTGVAYVGDVVWVKYTQDNTIVLELNVSATSLKEFKPTELKDKSKADIIDQIQDEVVYYHEPWSELTARECKKDNKKPDKVTSINSKKDSDPAVVSFQKGEAGYATDHVKGPDGVYISLEVFAEMTEDGCLYCAKDMTPEDADTMAWEKVGKREYKPICQSCLPEIMSASK